MAEGNRPMDLIAEMRRYAAEHFYTESWDLVTAWSDDQLAAAIGGARTRRGAISNTWGVLKHIDAARHGGSRPRKPEPLMAFLAKRGGLKPHPELKAILDGNPFIGGVGPLVRHRGAELDEARRVAVEGGYLPDTGWMGGVSTSHVNDLLDALRDEARGIRCYPYGEIGEDPAAFIEDDPAAYEESYDEVPF